MLRVQPLRPWRGLTLRQAEGEGLLAVVRRGSVPGERVASTVQRVQRVERWRAMH